MTSTQSIGATTRDLTKRSAYWGIVGRINDEDNTPALVVLWLHAVVRTRLHIAGEETRRVYPSPLASAVPQTLSEQANRQKSHFAG
jgi:hypothetical protein